MYQIDFNRPQHIHFIGIGGISMSGLAEVLLGRGFTVSGSDANDSGLLSRLKSHGALITIGQKAENITPDIDLIVYTAAIRSDNPEYAAAAASGLPMLTRAELLGELMQNYPVSIAVAGTHGKTTTTSMVSHVFLAGNYDPTISVGGMLDAIDGNIRVGNSDVFITEACEYTNSFFSLIPTIGIILNVDADHLDFFKDLDDIANSFHTFASQIPKEGVLIINRDSKKYDEVTKDLSCRIITYSLNQDADFTAGEIEFNAVGCGSFNCYEKGEMIGHISLSVPGIHNISNALATIASARHLDIPMDVIIQGMKNFTGADRRFEYKGKMGEVTIVDDYAHHPTEITATLKAAAACPHNSIWVVFQPHTYTRTKALLADFARALSAADHIVLAKIYPAREKDIYGISSRDLADRIADYGKDVRYLETFEEIQDYVRAHCLPGDILITMGAGNVTDIGPALLDS